MKFSSLMLSIIFILPVMVLNTGCAAAVIAGAGAAGGYIAHQKGYRVQNPVTKEESKKENKSN